jgi:hypothetical protein
VLYRDGDWLLCQRGGAGGKVGQSGGRFDAPRAGAKAGTKAGAQTRERLQSAPPEREPQRTASELGVLLVDGWQVRHRGPGWGAGETQQSRVAWPEMKLGVYYSIEQAGRMESGRGELAGKVVVSTLGGRSARARWSPLVVSVSAASKDRVNFGRPKACNT